MRCQKKTKASSRAALQTSTETMKTKERPYKKLQNPRLLRIIFRTFRHWKATMEYDKTTDCFMSCNSLVTKTSRIPLVYTQLADFEKDECHSAPANTVKEANKLIDAGFEYVALATTQCSSENASKRPYCSPRQR